MFLPLRSIVLSLLIDNLILFDEDDAGVNDSKAAVICSFVSFFSVFPTIFYMCTLALTQT